MRAEDLEDFSVSSFLHHQNTKLQSPILKGPAMPKLKRKMSLDICPLNEVSGWHACHVLLNPTLSILLLQTPSEHLLLLLGRSLRPGGQIDIILGAPEMQSLLEVRSSLGELEEFPEKDHLLRYAH